MTIKPTDFKSVVYTNSTTRAKRPLASNDLGGERTEARGLSTRLKSATYRRPLGPSGKVSLGVSGLRQPHHH